MAFLLDPSWVFGLACVLTPPLMACSPLIEFSQIAPRGCDPAAYFVHPLPIVSAILCIAFAMYCQSGKTAKLNGSDTRAANWYLVNAFIFKSIMDTCSGTLQSWGMMTQQYNMLEPRYQYPVSRHESIPVHLTSMLEMFVMVPLCLLTYRAMHKGYGSRYVYEIVTAVLQMTGTYYFYLAGIITQGDALVRMGTETNLFDRLFYFTFGNVFCPLLWLVYPCYRIVCAGRDISKLHAAAGKQR
eukprot:TRINITY_DN1940_c0_g1_i2.p1 TRINITY_DN1940_c0_g1~~TRINITY_DN1940_c0_g1_i2.p1  ORF type:complete len:267 (+),score=117.84 TRINITY_DN1940_c0_g1_i2:78-803(+)